MKIGIYGGTFDPVHNGHIALAEQALKTLQLDFLYIMPNGNPPHKEKEEDKLHRLEMVKLAFGALEKTVISDYEIQKESYSYTAETLMYLREKHPEDTFYLIMGMDSLQSIFSWKQPEIVCSLATLAVAHRPGYPVDEALLKRLQETYDARLSFLPMEYDISSTNLRQQLKKGGYLFDKMPLSLVRYILKHGLYGCSSVQEYDFYETELPRYIEEKRFCHSLGVAATAYFLALRYGEDCRLAYQAGLLHDIAKRMKPQQQLELSKKIKLHPDEIAYPKMLHAPAGAGFVKKQYGIKDKKLLSGIRYHTMGHKDMSLFDKIIYMADYIEPYRSFEGVEELRELAFSDIDRSIIRGIDTTILSLVEEGLKISPVLLEVRNGLLEREEKGF